MAYTTIDDPSAHFHTRLYSGNGSTQSITNNANAGNFKPDWLWIKERTSTSQHFLFDSTRGVGKYLHSDSTSLEGNDVHNTSFDSNGFGVGQQNGTNENSQTYVAWQWKANGGTTTSNSSGSNGAEADSVYQVNNTAGFSIGTYTGGGGGTFNIAIYTGLSAACEAVIVKNRDAAKDWAVGFGEKVSTSAARYLSLNNNDAAKSVGGNSSERQQGALNLNNFGAGLFDVTSGGAGDDDVYASGEKYVFYAFRSIKGYSKIGSYTGNGSTNGPFVYTGFKPAWIMIKRTDSANDWRLHDNKRSTSSLGGINPINRRLVAHTNAAEYTADGDQSEMDLLSNGYKINSNSGGLNTSSGTYAYIAFAEHPFVSSKGVPTTAR